MQSGIGCDDDPTKDDDIKSEHAYTRFHPRLLWPGRITESNSTAHNRRLVCKRCKRAGHLIFHCKKIFNPKDRALGDTVLAGLGNLKIEPNNISQVEASVSQTSNSQVEASASQSSNSLYITGSNAHKRRIVCKRCKLVGHQIFHCKKIFNSKDKTLNDTVLSGLVNLKIEPNNISPEERVSQTSNSEIEVAKSKSIRKIREESDDDDQSVRKKMKSVHDYDFYDEIHRLMMMLHEVD